MNRSSWAMKATAASTAKIHQRAGWPAAISPFASGPPEAAVSPRRSAPTASLLGPDPGAALRLAGAGSAIALLLARHGRAGRLRCKQSHRSVRHPDFDLGSITELSPQLSTPSLVRSMN